MPYSDGKVLAIVLVSAITLIGGPGRAHAGESLPKITTPAVKMTGMAVPTLRQPRITTPALTMTGVAVPSMRRSQITTPALQMTGMAVPTLRQSAVTTPALTMTGMAVPALRQSKITTPALEMTGLAVPSMRRSAITTPALQMTGMAYDGSSPELPERDAAPSMENAAGENVLMETGNTYTFSVPVVLENLPEQADSFKVAVSVVFSGGGIRTLVNEAERNISGGRFDGSVSIRVEPAATFSGTGLSYKAVLTLCSAGSCVSPLDPGAPAWARPEFGSSAKTACEGTLTSQTSVDVPALSMTGNKTDERFTPDAPAQNAAVEELSPEGSDRADASMDEPAPRTKSLRADASMEEPAPRTKSLI